MFVPEDGRFFMAKICEIVGQVNALIAGTVSFDEFEDLSADWSLSAHQWQNDGAMRLAYRISGILNDHHDDLSDNHALRDLAVAIRPFAMTQKVEWQEGRGVSIEAHTANVPAKPMAKASNPWGSASWQMPREALRL